MYGLIDLLGLWNWRYGLMNDRARYEQHCEQQLLHQLEQLKQELITLRNLAEHQQLADLNKFFLDQWQQLQDAHKQQKQIRNQLRVTHPEQILDLQRQSQRDGLDRRHFKRDRDQLIKPLESIVKSANQRIQEIHQERQCLYTQLQYYFQQISLEPLIQPLSTIYEDEDLVVIDKPAGMLSVPGRSGDRQSSALRYLQQIYPMLSPIHRLDQDTSGILMFAKNKKVHSEIQQQFAHHKVNKIYEALLETSITQTYGILELPLWGDPTERPHQRIDPDRGKPAITEFKKLASSRIELIPHTGRTHQLRVHMAQGLKNPILGDRLYGQLRQDQDSNQDANQCTDRLYLHAKYCRIWHQTQWLELKSTVPF